MTAPDPTAGEWEPCIAPPGNLCTDTGCWDADRCVVGRLASLPAVAASTGTSEDVETLAEALWNAMPAHHVGWRGLDRQSREFYRGNAERLLASDWLAAREAAAYESGWAAGFGQAARTADREAARIAREGRHG